MSAKKRKLNQLHDSTVLCQVIKERLVEVMRMKKSSGAGLNKDDATWKHKITEASLAVCDLKQSNREAQLHVETRKGEVNRSKQKLNDLNLQYQNIVYEKNHYLKEIKQCRDFKFDEREHSIMALEAFTKSAPKDQVNVSDPHQLMVNRLDFEIQERNRLCTKIHELKARKKALTELNASKQKFLDSLPERLRNVNKTSLPIQQHISVSVSKDLKQHDMSKYLPSPLYILFAQATSYKSVFEDQGLEVFIGGNLEEAVKIAKAAAPPKEEPVVETPVVIAEEIKTDSADSLSEDEDEVDLEESGHMLKKSSADVLVVTSSAELETPSTATTSPPSSTTTTISQQQASSTGPTREELYQPHPLAVLMEFKVKDSVGKEREKEKDKDKEREKEKEKVITFRFEYLALLGVVTVHPMHEDKYILNNLFYDDTGLASPIPNSNNNNKILFNTPISGRAFKWAQWLAGQGHLVIQQNPLYCNPPPLPVILSTIRTRLVARLGLVSLLDTLSKKHMPQVNQKSFPLAPHFNLISWKEVARSHFEDVQDGGEDKPTAQTEDVNSDNVAVPSWEKVGARYYCAVFLREQAQFEAVIEITTEYPVRLPTFKVRQFYKMPSLSKSTTTTTTALLPSPHSTIPPPPISSSTKSPSTVFVLPPPIPPNMLKSIEVEINTFTSMSDNVVGTSDKHTNEGSIANNVLAVQLRKLQQCLDVYYEVVAGKASAASSKSSSSGNSGTTSATEVGKFCIRPYRGRARVLPFMFNKDTGLFDQR